MKAEFGVGMPSCQKKEGVKDFFFMVLVFLWKESFKDRNDAL